MPTFRYITPIARREATGQVAAVYAQSAAELGQVALMMLSPDADLLAATWAALRESQLVGLAPRANKEAVAAAVSLANRCPFCVDAHTIFVHASGEHRLAETVFRGETPADPEQAALIAWARATRTLDASVLATPPFPQELAPEYIGTALVTHFVNRLFSALTDEQLLPANLQRLQPVRRALGAILALAARPRGSAGAPAPSTALHGEATPAWASETPIGPAFAAMRAAAMAGGGLLTAPGRLAVMAAVAAWDGRHPGLGAGWVDEALAGLPMAERPGPRLALLASLAPYRITDADVAAWRTAHPTDADLVRLLGFGALAAVGRIEEAIAPRARAGGK